MEGWRSTEADDSLLDNMGTKISKKFKQIITRQFYLPVSNIRTSRPEYLQFSLSSPFLTRDSLIEYYWASANSSNTTDWKRTAGFVTVPANGNGREWILGVRKAGESAVKQYKIQFEPRWYETPLCWFVVIILILMIAGFGRQFLKNRRLQKELGLQKQLNVQLISMKSILTPHMMLNAIAGLQDLHAGKKWDKARKFTLGLGGWLNESLARRDDLYCALEQEIEQVRKYISLQQLSFDFEYSMETEAPLNQQTLEVPAAILQPVVENAIKYNLAGSPGGILLVKAYLEFGKPVLLVESASPGQTQTGKKPLADPGSRGIGLHWVKNRLAIHNRLHPNAAIRLETNFEQGGARVSFCFQKH